LILNKEMGGFERAELFEIDLVDRKSLGESRSDLVMDAPTGRGGEFGFCENGERLGLSREVADVRAADERIS